MEFNKILRGRRSVREYSNRKVEKNKILKIIDAARHAPNACNYQNWFFVVTDKKDVIEKLHFVGVFHTKLSPVNIFVFYDKRFINKRYQDHIQSASAAIMTMIYKAYELGLGTCWVCDLPDENYIKKILNVPNNYQLIAMVNLGYSAQNKFPKKKLKSLKEILSFNEYKKKLNENNKTFKNNKKTLSFNIKRALRKFLVRLYLWSEE